ncbi:hypothetical protein [Azospirillum doebereinerae]|uniref:Uncharacterized protein n=1 Tax=Azospirillum doebereinerae TaxID=92933 RepID=A0A3S0X9P2_9PROT|nr:hypothetical protein [Azospirillum doebereinerae]MCG5239387.1 hypothetical protein [Azospirillum doebereinerae]RUQ67880.1 hypothetical protein EJ913_19660 [Azospirillum doebereinerae]
MPWQGWIWAAMVAGLAAGSLSGPARAAAVDCWLLDGDRMERAAGHGLCDDAFSRNSRPGEPPALGETASLPEPPPSPAALVTPPRKPKPRLVSSASARRMSGGPHASRTTPVHATRNRGSGDFASSFQRDFGALVDLLGGGSSGTGRQRAGADYPSHSGR